MKTPPPEVATPKLVGEKRAQSSETREALIAAAVSCISELGYSNATTPVIAEKAGVSRGALQYHFDSREELISAVIDEVASHLNFKLEVQNLRNQSIERRVDAVIDAYWLVFSGQKFIAALNIWLSVGVDAALAERLAGHVRIIKKRAALTWRDLFEDTRHTQAQLAAIRRLIMGTVRGYAVLRILDPGDQWKRDRTMVARLMLAALKDSEAVIEKPPPEFPAAVPSSQSH